MPCRGKATDRAILGTEVRRATLAFEDAMAAAAENAHGDTGRLRLGNTACLASPAPLAAATRTGLADYGPCPDIGMIFTALSERAAAERGRCDAILCREGAEAAPSCPLRLKYYPLLSGGRCYMMP